MPTEPTDPVGAVYVILGDTNDQKDVELGLFFHAEHAQSHAATLRSWLNVRVVSDTRKQSELHPAHQGLSPKPSRQYR